MLQFLTQLEDKYTVAEQMQMAVEGGCGWIIISQNSIDDAALREQAVDFIPMCREAGIMVTLENRPAVAKELGVHGVWLTDRNLAPRQIREELGPEAIIGVDVESPATVGALKAMDVDYATVNLDMGAEGIAQLVAQCRRGGVETLIVAVGDVTLAMVDSVMGTGVNGIATGRSIMQSDDPVNYIVQMIDDLGRVHGRE